MVFSMVACHVVGCGGKSGPPTGTVSGKITIGSEVPKDSIRVFFINSIIGQGSLALVEKDGTYHLEDPLHVAEYTVYFEKLVESTGEATTKQTQLKSIPKEYGVEATSPLKVKVEEGKNEINLDVPAA